MSVAKPGSEEITLCPTFAKGPLDEYRRQATFNWKDLRVRFHTEEQLRFKHEIWSTLEKDPLFSRSTGTSPTPEQYRELTFLRTKRLHEYNFLSSDAMLSSPMKFPAMVAAIGMYDWSLFVQKFLLKEFAISAITGSGTAQHDDLIQGLNNNSVTACFCLTEISHGTNAKAIRTTAKYIPETEEFELHTEDFEAAKAWSGNLGKTATHAVLFAQLMTPDGTNHGLHTFVVPIRDPCQLRPYSGLTIGDMGEKIGLNGFDNGFMLLNHYRVPKKCLLNKFADVTPEGVYITPFRDPNKRFGASLGTLSSGRTGIINMGNINLQMAVVIAIRYSAARRQFTAGHNDQELESPVIEYQMQQCRLFPYLAAAYVHHFFFMSFSQDFLTFTVSKISRSEDPDVLAAMGMEIHGLSSAGKPLASWTAQHALQECREACGGHGYLKASRLGELRNNNDSNCTYEGDNNVLLQQTSNWLLNVWQNSVDMQSPFGSLAFLREAQDILKRKLPYINKDKLCNPRFLLDIYHKLVVHLLQYTSTFVQQQVIAGRDKLEVKNNSQFFMARSVSLVFIESVAIDRAIKTVEDGDWPPEQRHVLNQLTALYGLSRLEDHASHLFQFNILQPQHSELIHTMIVQLCLDLKPNVVALADVLAPPDFILNSALGHSNGQIYKNLQATFYANPNCFSRAEFWPEVVAYLKSRL